MENEVKNMYLFISEEVCIVSQHFKAKSPTVLPFINVYLVVIVITFIADLILSVIPQIALP